MKGRLADLVSLLANEPENNEQTRASAARVLGALCTPSVKGERIEHSSMYIRELVKLLGDTSPYVRGSTIELLLSIGEQDRAINNSIGTILAHLPAIASLQNDSERYVAVRAREAVLNLEKSMTEDNQGFRIS